MIKKPILSADENKVASIFCSNSWLCNGTGNAIRGYGFV